MQTLRLAQPPFNAKQNNEKQLLTLALLAVAGTAGAQYQLPNGNFEGGTYTSSQKDQTIPNDWNWFDKGTGKVISTALGLGGMTCSVETESGNNYVKLVANKFRAYPTANGNLTTGTINAGESLKAASDGGLKTIIILIRLEREMVLE